MRLTLLHFRGEAPLRGFPSGVCLQMKDPLAITYNDQSPLENHHLAASYRLLMRSHYNFLEVGLLLDWADSLACCSGMPLGRLEALSLARQSARPGNMLNGRHSHRWASHYLLKQSCAEPDRGDPMGVEAVVMRLTHAVGAGMQNLTKEDQATIRTAIIEEVLATDMKRHFNIISTFQVWLKLGHNCGRCWSAWLVAF